MRTVSARLSRCQPRALRARSGSDRRAIAATMPTAKPVRVVGGLGTIARVVTDHRRDLSRAPDPSLEARGCASKPSTSPITPPSNSADRATRGQRFGFAVLVDCHSMPSNPDRGPSDATRGRTSCSATASAAPVTASLPRFVAAQVAGHGLRGGEEQALRRRLHHRAPTGGRPRAIHACRSRSTARSIIED